MRSLKKFLKKRKREDSNYSVIESSEESIKARQPRNMYFSSHSTDSSKDLRAMVNNHKQKKKNNFRSYGEKNKERNALIEKKFQKFVKNKKKRKTEKEL